MIGGDWRPLHTPDGRGLLDFVAFVEITLPNGDGSIHGSEGQGLTVRRPRRTHDLLLILLFGDVLLARGVDREVGGTAREQLVGQGVESQCDDGFRQGEFQVGFDFALGLEVEAPQHAGFVVADLGFRLRSGGENLAVLGEHDTVDGVLHWVSGDVPALVGLVTTSPF